MTEPSTTQDQGAAALQEALRLSFRALRAVLVLLFLAYLASGVFIVRQNERAFVLHFGKISGLGTERIKEPGLHWTWPRPFSEILRVPTERVQTLATQTFWYGTESDFQDNAGPGETLTPGRDGYTLTGDVNLLHSRWAVRYTIDQPEKAVFGFTDLSHTILQELDRAVVRVSARFPVDHALRTELESLRAAVDAELRRRNEELGLGLKIQGVDLLGVTPPRQVADSFDAVVQAEQHRAKSISEARAYAARTLNEAKGEAEKTRVEGDAFRKRLLSEISAEADYFDQVYAKFKTNPEVVSRSLLQDTLRRSLSHVVQKYIVPSGAEGAQEIRLQLSHETEAPGEEAR